MKNLSLLLFLNLLPALLHCSSNAKAADIITSKANEIEYPTNSFPATFESNKEISLYSNAAIFADNSTIRSTLIGNDGHNDDVRPMGVGVYDRESNKTYMVYMNTTGKGNAYVVTCDHNNNNTWDNGNTVGIADQDDNHNYPQIVLPDDGRPIVVYGAHNIPLKIAKMDVAGDPTSWTSKELTQADDGSYPMPIKTRNGDIYIFYRVTVANVIRPMYYVKSVDNGVTWSQPVMAIQRAVDAEGFREIYVGMISEEPYREGVPQRFHFSWTLAGASIPANNHDWAREGLYHAYFEPENEQFYSADGTSLGSSINETDMDNYCEIVPPQRDPLRQGYMGYAPMNAVSGTGEILIWEFHDDGDWEDVVHYFNGSSWQVQAGSGLSVYPKGIDYFNGKHYFIGNSRNNIFQGTSNNGVSFSNDFYYSMTGAQSGAPTTTIPIREGHPAARFWSKETAGEPTNVWAGAVSGDGSGIASNLKANTSDATIAAKETTTIKVFVCDEVAGGYGRITNATNSISLSIESGDGKITSSNPVNAVNGKAEFTVEGGYDNMVIRADASGLASTRINIFSSSEAPDLLEITNYTANTTDGIGTVTYYSPDTNTVNVTVNDASNTEVITMSDTPQTGGGNQLNINLSEQPNGQYHVILNNGSTTQSCNITKEETIIVEVLEITNFTTSTTDGFATITYFSPDTNPVDVTVFDDSNNEILTTTDSPQYGADNQLTVDLNDEPAGQYIITLNNGTTNVSCNVTKPEDIVLRDLEILSKSPNPVIDDFSFTFYSPEDGNVTAKITDDSNLTILEQTISAKSGEDNANTFHFNFSEIASGSYTCELSNGITTDTWVIIKNEIPNIIILEKSYPNPTKGLFAVEIQCSQKLSIPIEIVNESNEVVLTKNYSAKVGRNKIVLNLSKLPDGVFKVDIGSGSDMVHTMVTKDSPKL